MKRTRRTNSVRRDCPECGRTDTLIDLSTGLMCRHRVRKARGALWCAGSGVRLADPIRSAPPHPRGGYNPTPEDAVIDVVEVAAKSPPPPTTISDQGRSVRTVRGGLPTLGKKR